MFFYIRPFPKPRRKTSRAQKALFLFLCTMVTAVTLSVYVFDKNFLPRAIEIADIKAATEINRIINDAISLQITSKKLTTADFYSISASSDGKIQSMSVNTILANSLCAELAVLISNNLSNGSLSTVNVPMGALAGISGLAAIGPTLPVKLQPIGAATVDYSSSFTAAGINQINFKIHLQINTRLKIVNPLQKTEITVTRQILLADTVFAGEIPSVYINGLEIKE